MPKAIIVLPFVRKYLWASAIIDPAIQKHNELRLVKAREPKIRSAEDFIEDKGI
jgi:hypothetical protein